MIIIEVTTVNGQPCADPLAAEFDELGGNIGRAEGNTLVLADPEKVISRRHASIAFRGGRYVLSDHGTATPVYVNGRALGNGQESPIDVGDEIRIGGFTLRVKPGAAAAAPAAERAAPPHSRTTRPRRARARTTRSNCSEAGAAVDAAVPSTISSRPLPGPPP